jgi:hypothetical protein
VARQVWRVFLQSGYKFNALDECRGTSLGGKREVVQLYKFEERPVEQHMRRLPVSKLQISPVVGTLLRAEARVRVQANYKTVCDV